MYNWIETVVGSTSAKDVQCKESQGTSLHGVFKKSPQSFPEIVETPARHRHSSRQVIVKAYLWNSKRKNKSWTRCCHTWWRSTGNLFGTLQSTESWLHVPMASTELWIHVPMAAGSTHFCFVIVLYNHNTHVMVRWFCLHHVITSTLIALWILLFFILYIYRQGKNIWVAYCVLLHEKALCHNENIVTWGRGGLRT